MSRRLAVTGTLFALSVAGAGTVGVLGLLANGCGGSTGDAADATTGDAIVVPVVDAPIGDDADDAPAMVVDAGPTTIEAGCSPVNGVCDVVLNNCAAADGGVAECLPGSEAGTSFCEAERPSQHLPLGHSCCPSESQATEPCLPGLECFGDPCTTDGAAPTARCTPRCCSDDVCGTSTPEGIAGHCDLDVVNQNEDVLYRVCTYDLPCKPFHVQPCPAGNVCLVSDKLGTATCASVYRPYGDGGEYAPCAAANSCNEGLMCLGTNSGDGGMTTPDGGDGGDDAGDDDISGGYFCFYNCIVPGTTPPFDASASAAPGYGGCPSGEVCTQIDPTQFPTWLGYCGAP